MFGNLDREQKPLLFTALCATLVCEVCVAYFAKEKAASVPGLLNLLIVVL